MKKKIRIPEIIILILLVLLAGYYFTPKTFGENVNSSEVDHIEVFNGNSGNSFTITDPKDIKYIVENIQSNSMKKDGLSVGRMGYGFKITYVDSNDKEIVPAFILDNDNTIRKDPFYYSCEGELCFDYIDQCEENYSK